jgi:hypothetical protein
MKRMSMACKGSRCFGGAFGGDFSLMTTLLLLLLQVLWSPLPTVVSWTMPLRPLRNPRVPCYIAKITTGHGRGAFLVDELYSHQHQHSGSGETDWDRWWKSWRQICTVDEAEVVFQQLIQFESSSTIHSEQFQKQLLDAYNAMLAVYATAAIHDDRVLTRFTELLGYMVDNDKAPAPDETSYALLLRAYIDRHEYDAASELWQTLLAFAKVQPAWKNLTSSKVLQAQYQRLQDEWVDQDG